LYRFWGTPIPIWASDDGEEIRVIGSIAELEEVAGRKVGGNVLFAVFLCRSERYITYHIVCGPALMLLP
jgi:isoleucyl-tRNA synthetase